LASIAGAPEDLHPHKQHKPDSYAQLSRTRTGEAVRNRDRARRIGNRHMSAGLWDPETFVENLRAIGVRAYHDKHPFHVAMNEARLSQEALRGWVANRFYYQRNIPIKDAAILSNCPLREVRRIWIHRILDHDGTGENEGGIETWLRLGQATGLSRDELM